MITRKLTERDITSIFDDAVQAAGERTDIDHGTAIVGHLRQELGEGVTLLIPTHAWPIGHPERIPDLYRWLIDWIRQNP